MQRTATLLKAANVAVVLCGCGVFDGAEIHESTSVLIHLSARKAQYKIFAPSGPQMHVIDHQAGAEAKETRQIDVESARIARGPVLHTQDWMQHADNFDALVIPGGFGAMKNLSDFAVKGGDGAMRPELVEMVRYFHSKKRPIAVSCIAPLLLAYSLGTRNGGPGVNITIGALGNDFVKMGEGFGATMQARAVDEICVDEEQRVVTTPAYMIDTATPADIHGGIGKMIEKALEMVK